MATSSNNNNNNKPVTGYPAQPMTGYPATAATGSAYPYQYQQQQQQQHHPPPNPYYQAMAYPPPPAGPTYYYGQSNRRRIVRRLIIGCIILFSIMGLIFFISWLVLKPRLPEFQVNSASVSQLNTTLSELTATWAFTVFVNNPNHKLTISYDKLQASVFYNDRNSPLGITELAPFQQGKRNQTTLSFEVVVVSFYVGESTVKSINLEKASGSVDFGVKIMALVRFRAGIWRMREHLMRVDCDPLKFSFSSSSSNNNNNNGTGTMLPQSQSKPCYVVV